MRRQAGGRCWTVGPVLVALRWLLLPWANPVGPRAEVTRSGSGLAPQPRPPSCRGRTPLSRSACASCPSRVPAGPLLWRARIGRRSERRQHQLSPACWIEHGGGTASVDAAAGAGRHRGGLAEPLASDAQRTHPVRRVDLDFADDVGPAQLGDDDPPSLRWHGDRAATWDRRPAL